MVLGQNSIRSSIREIKNLNLKDNKKFYYINLEEWEKLIEEEIIESAIADASEEVMNGEYSQFQLAEMVNRHQVIQIAVNFLSLTYSHSAKDLPTAVAQTLIQLPGGENWINRQKQ